MGREAARSDSDAARHQLARRLDHAVSGLDDPATPMVVVDLDAFDANAADLARRAAGKPVRVASKSLRVPALVRRALAAPGFAGVLAYSLREALWLVARGSHRRRRDGLPHASTGSPWPTCSPTRRPAAEVTLMVDDPAHLSLIEAAAPDGVRRTGRDRHRRRACGWAARTSGPKRSPLHDAAEVVAFAREVVDRGFALVGVMTYEGQVAGVPGRRTPPAGEVARRPQAQVGLGRPARGASCRDRRGSCATWSSWSSGTPVGPAASSRPSPTRSSPRSPPGRGCWCRGSSTTTRASSRGRRRSSASPSYAAPATGWSPSPAAGSSRADRPARTGPRSPGRRPDLHLTGLEGAGEVQTPLTGAGAAPAPDRRLGVVPARQVRRARRAHQPGAPARRRRDRRDGARPTAASGWPGDARSRAVAGAASRNAPGHPGRRPAASASTVRPASGQDDAGRGGRGGLRQGFDRLNQRGAVASCTWTTSSPAGRASPGSTSSSTAC